ncbi:elongation factor P hydroxylase [Psychrobacter sp. I-STPA10]|uniref:elongation factor P hydroxylase n=1 Tax=Psychrobacter sp. I-STPA10 TaxID=2585769 RepID=UPI001E2C466C|nr:elongation factor P hydroxylase [Psychrobacter sp. I-STPA10]
MNPQFTDFKCQKIPKLQMLDKQKQNYIQSHYPSPKQLRQWQQQWQHIQYFNTATSSEQTCTSNNKIEAQQVQWLIDVFNDLFHWQNVKLVKGNTEPEYFPATIETPAQIVFAHGYFSSALHEISHWSIAGKKRRTLADFGYWYAPDGRSPEQQRIFEQVEVKPQAIECLLTWACKKNFHTSKDNLEARFALKDTQFDQDVHQQIQNYLFKPDLLPKDALLLINTLNKVCS